MSTQTAPPELPLDLSPLFRPIQLEAVHEGERAARRINREVLQHA